MERQDICGEYLMIAQNSPHITQFVRQSDMWIRRLWRSERLGFPAINWVRAEPERCLRRRGL